jgi:3',5'-cyclic AMP phosphodiesterase CpdA
MRRIAHLSDLHYGADPRAQPKLYDGLLSAFDDQQVDAIIFTGDVFDSNEPKPGLVEGFIRLHAGLEAKLGGPKPTIILPGNHDRRGDGVFAPYREDLFAELSAKFAATRPDVKVLGGNTPFLAQHVPLPDFPCDVVAYDSAYLPAGFASAGGVIRQADLLQVGSELARGDPERPLLFLLHHHLIPTPVTDTSVIDTSGRPPLQKFLVSKILPWLVSNGDREELTMTALGAGSALTTLQTLGRAVIVLHGHKHYATARVLKGLDGDADLLITSAGSCGMTQDWTGGQYEQAPKLWPSVNFVQFDGDNVQVTSQAWSPFQPDRHSSARHLVSASRDGRQWKLELPPLREAQFHPVLTMNELEAKLVTSTAHLGRLDVLTRRTLASHERAWLEEYWEVLEGPAGATARELKIHGGANWKDAKCPAKVKLSKDGVSTWRIEGGLFANLHAAQSDREGKAYESVELLNRSRADVARLRVDMGPVKTTPFASITNLTTGKERPYPLTREGDVVTVMRTNCPARTLLRLYWPLER